MASLEAAASTAPGFSILSHVVKCFQSAGFDADRMMACVAGAFHRISKAGIEHMSDIWREVSRCVADLRYSALEDLSFCIPSPKIEMSASQPQ